MFVRVETDPGICTAVSSSFTESQTVTLAPGVTKVFPIAIAATKVGNPNIMVFARSHDGFIADGVSRRLRVVVSHHVHCTYNLGQIMHLP